MTASARRTRAAAIAFPARAHAAAPAVLAPFTGWLAPLAAALALLAAPACDRLPSGPARSTPAAERGISLVAWTADGYSAPVADSALVALAATGANTAVLVMTAYQPEPAGSLIDAQHPLTPTVGSVAHALDVCEGLGLRTVLKPHVDLGGGAWRGTIDPIIPSAWFQSYQRFIVPWAALAELKGVSRFVVGTELAGTVQYERPWRETIAKVRAVYHGELVYAASWDEAGRVRFWDALDAVGVDFYAPVAARERVSRVEVLAGWQPWLARLERLHGQTGKPILLTEIGYRSVDGAGMSPFAHDSGGAIDLEEQADLYWAALQAVASCDWISGIYWWNWPTVGSGGTANDDYTPRGKPAERVLVDAWRSGS